ncbi:MAG: hypothetical protein HYV63_22295 [Candidatus Schekmanbacteria bacterium]|nr:hypothetical protein [Candidatus Schekmanbacteria bacterium]
MGCRQLVSILLLVSAPLALLAGHAVALESGPIPADNPGEARRVTWGAGGIAFFQAQDFEVRELSVAGFDLSDVRGADVDNAVLGSAFAVDFELFPWLTLIGVLGVVDGETELSLRSYLPRITAEYSGVLYGGGAVLRHTAKSLFGEVAIQYTGADLGVHHDLSSLTVRPRLGYRHGDGDVELWAGPAYWRARERHSGTVDARFVGDVRYDLLLRESSAFSVLLGCRARVAARWRLQVELAAYEALAVDAGLAYRF